MRDTTAALVADPSNLGPVTDAEERERYAREVRRIRSTHAPDDVV